MELVSLSFVHSGVWGIVYHPWDIPAIICILPPVTLAGPLG
jgi:hypothetical protein